MKKNEYLKHMLSKIDSSLNAVLKVDQAIELCAKQNEMHRVKGELLKCDRKPFDFHNNVINIIKPNKELFIDWLSSGIKKEDHEAVLYRGPDEYWGVCNIPIAIDLVYSAAQHIFIKQWGEIDWDKKNIKKEDELALIKGSIGMYLIEAARSSLVFLNRIYHYPVHGLHTHQFYILKDRQASDFDDRMEKDLYDALNDKDINKKLDVLLVFMTYGERDKFYTLMGSMDKSKYEYGCLEYAVSYLHLDLAASKQDYIIAEKSAKKITKKMINYKKSLLLRLECMVKLGDGTIVNEVLNEIKLHNLTSAQIEYYRVKYILNSEDWLNHESVFGAHRLDTTALLDPAYPKYIVLVINVLLTYLIKLDDIYRHVCAGKYDDQEFKGMLHDILKWDDIKELEKEYNIEKLGEIFRLALFTSTIKIDDEVPISIVAGKFCILKIIEVIEDSYVYGSNILYNKLFYTLFKLSFSLGLYNLVLYYYEKYMVNDIYINVLDFVTLKYVTKVVWISVFLYKMDSYYIEITDGKYACSEELLAHNINIFDEKISAEDKGNFYEELRKTKIIHFMDSRSADAYIGAEKAFQNIDYENKGCIYDVAPVSLGFFRILEMELDRLILKPLRESVINDREFKERLYNFNVNRKKYMWKYKELKKSGDIKGLEEFKKDTGFNNSDDYYEAIILTFTNKKRTFGLNDMWVVVSGNFTSSLDKMDKKLSDDFDSKLRNIFSDDGKKALKYKIKSTIRASKGVVDITNNRVSDIISHKKRSMYRNPPAHTKTLNFVKAQECREHVNDSLMDLYMWVEYS